MQSKRFQRRTEDFLCARCGQLVQGNGYTNHCPSCLWSRHVDLSPGDRAADCKALMKPVRLERSHGEFVIIHRCTGCHKETRIRSAVNDDFESLLSLN